VFIEYFKKNNFIRKDAIEEEIKRKQIENEKTKKEMENSEIFQGLNDFGKISEINIELKNPIGKQYKRNETPLIKNKKEKKEKKQNRKISNNNKNKNINININKNIDINKNDEQGKKEINFFDSKIDSIKTCDGLNSSSDNVFIHPKKLNEEINSFKDFENKKN